LEALAQVLRVGAVAVNLVCVAALLRTKKGGADRARSASILLAAAIALHVMILGLRACAVGFFPFSSAPDVLVLLSLLVLVAHRAAGSPLRGSLAEVSVYLCSAVLVALSLFGTATTDTAPELRSALLPIHVVGAIAAYACFTLNFLARAYLCIRAGSARRRETGPEAPVEALARRCALAGWALYAIFVLGMGMVWARSAWGRYWGWDPKETMSLVAFCVYSLYLYFEAVIKPDSRGLLGALSAVGYLTLLLTAALGMGLAGLHSHV